MTRVRIFISSPGDVADERQRALAVVEQLQQEFETLSLEPLLWEQEPLLATADFQSQIRSPADFDIFATIIGSRLGSPLGSQFTRRDGTPYASGTEFEFEMAIASHHASGKPELLFYRKEQPAGQPATAQLEKVSAFFEKWFSNNADSTAIGEYYSFADTVQFEQLFTGHLREQLHRLLPKPNNLPAAISSFLGRVDLIRDISALLRQSDVQLLNLTAPPGVGKSRLSLRTARGLLADFEHGVFLVKLTSTGEESSLADAIADTLDIECDRERPAIEQVVDALRNKEMLLLLDDLEIQEPLVNGLLKLRENCPGVKLLVTSREAVPIDDVQVINVPPFALPDTDAASFAEIRDNECVQLFLARAQVVREGFALTEENARDILDICQQLKGVPLSIELAASRMRTMNISKMLRSLASIKVRDATGQTIYLIPR